MSLALTPARLAAVYDCLLEFPPFNRWKLPRTATIEFGVTQTPHDAADTTVSKDWHRLRVSAKNNGHFDTVAASVAHEMIHLALYVAGMPNWHTHSEEFNRRARRVCRLFGWDEKVF